MYSNGKVRRNTDLKINNTKEANSLTSPLKRKENIHDSQKASDDNLRKGDLPKGNILYYDYVIQTGDTHKYLQDGELSKAPSPSSEYLQWGNSSKTDTHAVMKIKLTQETETGEEYQFDKDESKNIESHEDEREKWIKYKSPPKENKQNTTLKNINKNTQSYINEKNDQIRTLMNTIENKTIEAARHYVENLTNHIQVPNDPKMRVRAHSNTHEALEIVNAAKDTRLTSQHPDTLPPHPDITHATPPRNNTSPHPHASDQRQSSEGENDLDGVAGNEVTRGAAVVTQVKWLLTEVREGPSVK